MTYTKKQLNEAIGSVNELQRTEIAQRSDIVIAELERIELRLHRMLWDLQATKKRGLNG